MAKTKLVPLTQPTPWGEPTSSSHHDSCKALGDKDSPHMLPTHGRCSLLDLCPNNSKARLWCCKCFRGTGPCWVKSEVYHVCCDSALAWHGSRSSAWSCHLLQQSISLRDLSRSLLKNQQNPHSWYTDDKEVLS